MNVPSLHPILFRHFDSVVKLIELNMFSALRKISTTGKKTKKKVSFCEENIKVYTLPQEDASMEKSSRNANMQVLNSNEVDEETINDELVAARRKFVNAKDSFDLLAQ